MKWDPQRYLKFGDYRTQPASDLLARVPVAEPRRVVDLGCGPGNSTRLLVERWPGADVTGVDKSAEMLAAARNEPDLASVWSRGSALLPFLALLAPEERPAFEARYGERLRAAYPRRADGRTLFPFVRLFLVAQAREE